MSRKVIDIGAIGNDGTGDSIRDSFRKVNDNFRELYSSLGLGERLRFIGLDDTPAEYTGQENSILAVNATEDGIAFKALTGGPGILIDYDTDSDSIYINNLLSDISGDTAPNLGGALSAQFGINRYPIGNLLDLSSASETSTAKSLMESTHGSFAADSDRLAANKGYVDTKISLAGIDAIDPATNSNTTEFGEMLGPLVLSRDPLPEDDEVWGGRTAATKRYVDNAGFGSSVNLYVATSGSDDRPNINQSLQGRSLATAYKTIEAALKKAEELVLESPIEMGPYKKVLTYNNGASECTLTAIGAVESAGSGFSGRIYMSVDSVDLASTGNNLYLPGDTLVLSGGTFIQACTLEVLSVNVVPGTGGRGAISTFRVVTQGVYTALPGAVGVGHTVTGGSGIGATFDLTFNVNKVEVLDGGTGYGLVSIRIEGGGGTGAFGRADVVSGEILGITITDRGSGFTSLPNIIANLPRFLIETGGLGTDFTGNVLSATPEAVRTRDLREGLLLRGEISGALALILAHQGALSTETGLETNEIFDVDIISGNFIIGEAISYGDVTKPVQICVFVESGIYEENYPLKLSQNVAIIGDEFRRTIIRPRSAVPDAPLSGMSSSPWASLNFRRDPVIDGTPTTEQLYGYHYLSDQTQPIYPLFENRGLRRATAELLNLNREFIKTQVIGWLNNQIVLEVGDFAGFEYDNALCRRDVGLIIDAMVFDLKYGGYSRTVSAALKYFQSVSSLLAIGDQLFATRAGIEKINSLALDIIANTEITILYTLDGTEFDISNPSNTYSATVNQLIDQSYVSESGSADVINNLITCIINIIENSGAANYPKDNNQLDVFLCNDANIIRAVTCQGHGGFMMVLDPEGQILTKSPYCQESASFSRSTGRKTFAGGMYVDGFTGNQRFYIDSRESSTLINVSGLLRPPQTPCSFIVSDTIYRINYIRNYTYGILDPTDPGATTAGGYSSVQFIIDETTPFTGNIDPLECTFGGSPGSILVTTTTAHELQPSAIVQFYTDGTLPTGLETGKDYYVLLDGFTENTFRVASLFGSSTPVEITSSGAGTHTVRRIFEVLMPGNRSMLSNDYTQVNDLGYGLIVANGGLTEAVSMFTYYCQISYYATSGGQIRSVGGSSSHGNYALVAEGSDPLEVPTPVGLYHKLQQGVTVVANTVITQNIKGGTVIYVQYDDYLPLSGSEIEVNHNNVITRYAVSSSESYSVANKIAKLTISSGGGLEQTIAHGTRLSVRMNSFVILTGDVVDVATRPSTALVLNDGVFVYRILEFNDYDEIFDKDTFTIVDINTTTGVITTDIPHRQQVGYQIKIRAEAGDILPSAIVAVEDGPPEVIGEIYYIESVVSPTEFTISTSSTGAALDLSSGPSYGGTLTATMKPYGLALTQLRENYAYTVCDLYSVQPFYGSTVSCTLTAADPTVVSSVGHGLTAGTQIRFDADVAPGGIDLTAYYYVVSKDLGVDDFKITDSPSIESTQLGVEGILDGTTISGLLSTANVLPGMRLVSKPDIDIINVIGDGATATVTFDAQILPPYEPGQIVNISGVSIGGYDNATATVVTCTTTTLTYTNATTGTGTGGTVAVVVTGSLGTDPVVISVTNSTTIVISSTGSSDGTVIFNIEGAEIEATSTGTNVVYGRLYGDQGLDTIAITDLPAPEENRLTNAVINFQGEEYQVTDYVANPGGALYSLLTVDRPFVVSPIRTLSPSALRAGVYVPSQAAIGTLTIRIALVRVTSHDFLEIGTGSYADTNYPSEIFGQAVNDFNTVPVYVTDFDEDGNVINRAQVQERDVGRVFFVTTDQYGNFSVGPFFKVDQGTGTVTFSASIALSQLDGLGFKRGSTVSEFSVDDSMADAANDAVPTEGAVVGYINRRLGLTQLNVPVLPNNLIPPLEGGFMPLKPPAGVVMKGDMNLGSFNITNLADPALGTDAANLNSINISNLKDTDGSTLFNLTDIQAGQIAAFTGEQNKIGNFTTNGDVLFSIESGDSSVNQITTAIASDSIVNDDINSSAAIDQSKLSLVSASTRVNAVGITQADKGVASFDSSTFTSTSGWISVTPNGVALDKIAKIANNSVLGNSSGTSPDSITAVPFSTVVDTGGSVKKSQFSSGTGILRRSNSGAGNYTADAHYEIVDAGSTSTASTIVRRDANKDFVSRYITAEQTDAGQLGGFKVQPFTSTAYTVLDSNQVSGTNGFTRLFTYGGGGGSANAGIEIGAGSVTTDDKTNYNNTTHNFRSKNGGTTFAVLDSSGFNLGTRTLTTGAITTGSSTTSGTITGQWILADTPGGSTRTNSRLQATYAADLAEFYEGDKEYETGTVLIFGGDKEVTVSNKQGDTRVAGVVSDNAAYSMYGACPGFKNQIALQGRVPCKVVGKINKGDILITSNIPGVAIAAKGTVTTGSVVGKAIETYDSDHIGTIQVAVGRT